MSGEMNTSLGNGFANLMAFLFLCEERELPEPEGYVEGDDGVFAVMGDPPTAQDAADLGFKLKIDVYDNVNEASFCGVIVDDVDLCIITNPIEELVTFGWISRKYILASNKKLRGLLRCKALSLIYSYPGCPILWALGSIMLTLTEGTRIVVPEDCMWHRDKMIEAIREYTHGRCPIKIPGKNTRLLMEKKFNVTVEDQIKIENHLLSMTSVSPINFPPLDQYFKRSWRVYYDHYVYEPDLNCREDLYYPHILRVRGVRTEDIYV